MICVMAVLERHCFLLFIYLCVFTTILLRRLKIGRDSNFEQRTGVFT